MTEMTRNTSFSQINPAVQVAIDSTSLGEFKLCPRRYFYSIVEGWQPRSESVHLTFGNLVHRATEMYDRLKFLGRGHEEALDEVVDWSLRTTWNKALARPWISNDATKNRVTFLRSIVWFLDQFGRDDPMKTLALQDGSPAVELSFEFDTGLKAPTGEQIRACGHLDRLVEFQGSEYIVDRKTTGKMLDAKFWSQFSPDNQFSMYCIAGRIAFARPIKGLIVDALRVTATFTQFQRAPVGRDDATLEEWLGDFGFWTRQMHSCAVNDNWPLNDKACGLYGGCPFRKVCSRSPIAREQWLKADYERRIWDPLLKRGVEV